MHFIHSIPWLRTLRPFAFSQMGLYFLLPFCFPTYMNVIIVMMANKHVFEEKSKSGRNKKVDKTTNTNKKVSVTLLLLGLFLSFYVS